MRLFFSLKFTPEQQQLLQPYQQQALDLCPAAKAVDVDNLHLTLFFLGQVDATQQQQLISAVKQITIPPFGLTLDTLSGFSRPKIVYLAPSEVPDALLQLHQQLAALC
ncbi:RNA 2',3'-cyclic phosphodiesterase [Rheinheimera sp. FR7-31]